MDEISARLVYLLTDLILPLIVGYLLYQRRLLTDTAVNRLIRINVVVFFTLLSLFSFWALPLTHDLLMLPAFFAFIILFPSFLSWRFLGRRFHSPIDRGTHLISAMLSNIGTLGGICAYIIYGERGFAYAQIGGACQNLALVLLAFPIAQYFYLLHKARGRAPRLEGRSFLGLLVSWNQLSILGMAAGLLLNASGAARPPVLAEAFSYIIHVSAWFAMLPVVPLFTFAATPFHQRSDRTERARHLRERAGRDQRHAHRAALPSERRLYDCRLPRDDSALSHRAFPRDIFPVSIERSVSYG